MEKERRHIIFSGRVQDVGFRYKACCLARSLGLTGWVRNLWDGTVEMEVQGTEEKICRLITGLDQDRYIRIQHMETAWLPTAAEEQGFKERY